MGSQFSGIKPRTFLGLVIALGLAACLLPTIHFIRASRLLPCISSTFPIPNELGVAVDSRVKLTFNKPMLAETANLSTFVIRDDHDRIVPATVTYQPSGRAAVLAPSWMLTPGTTYEATVVGGPQGVRDSYGHPLTNGQVWKFTTGVAATSEPSIGPGGPILLITNSANGFSQYYSEILRNEGFNEFAAADIVHLTPALLRKFDVVLLPEISINDREARVLTAWVRAGGDLVAMRPDRSLAQMLSVTAANSHPKSRLHDAYLAISAETKAGGGLVHKPIQFHGPADQYEFHGGVELARLYQDARIATGYPAVFMLKYGRGQVTIFTYDLARSVIYTRQGNPLWSGQERDGISPIRSDDLFYGPSRIDPQPDWVDPDRIEIPQADEQQRLLGNIITLMSAEKMPLPHFWYLPRGLKAAIVMTGDDHGGGGTEARFRHYLSKSPIGCSVENWDCIRGTSYLFVKSFSTASAASFVDQGFEIGLHVYTGCVDWPTQVSRLPDGGLLKQVDRTAANRLYDRQLEGFASKYADVPPPVSNRIDCVTWGDYDTQPQVELSHGIRFDTNYYYWPKEFVRNRPGLFTGSGMPMRFARRDGTLIDVYQAATQMTDESKQVYPYTVERLLSNALGDAQYFGVFTANMHNDRPISVGADAVIASAVSQHVPIVTASQMLTWLDGRNASSFQNLTWSRGHLSFSIAVATGGNGLQALLPMTWKGGKLDHLTLDGVEVGRSVRSIAGLDYAAFSAAPGKFLATYRALTDGQPKHSGQTP
jgi:hypothetical protein